MSVFVTLRCQIPELLFKILRRKSRKSIFRVKIGKRTFENATIAYNAVAAIGNMLSSAAGVEMSTTT